MFVILYCLPLAVIAFLFIRCSMEIKVLESTGAAATTADDALPSTSETSYQSRVTWSSALETDLERTSDASAARGSQYGDRFYMATDADDLDLKKEKRGQQYLITMVILYAICWCPINILILVTHFVLENEDNSGHFDVTYATLTFIAYLSTCTNPVLFAHWHMSESTRDKLIDYLQFNNMRRTSEHPDEQRRHDQLLEDGPKNVYN